MPLNDGPCFAVLQIDPRILKAAAIEHAEDVDAAVEFILSDVLPNEVVDLSAEGKNAVLCLITISFSYPDA